MLRSVTDKVVTIWRLATARRPAGFLTGDRDPLLVEQLEPRVMLAGVLVGDYLDDFPEAGVLSEGWQLLWNAPQGWTPATGSTGDMSTGGIGDPGAYRPLQYTGSSRAWTADGDLLGNNHHPDRWVRLSANGGSPGLHAGPLGNGHDRYAIAAFIVDRAGLYEITDSYVAANAASNSDGIEVLVHVNADPHLLHTIVAQDSSNLFDTTLGYLSEGDTIYVAMGAGGNHFADFFVADFSIYRVSSEILVANYRNDFPRDQEAAAGWKYLWNAPQLWSAGAETGLLHTGSIEQTSSYRSLQNAGSGFWTADGDLDGTNHNPDRRLRLSVGGGAPGLHAGPMGNTLPRYAIAAFTVSRSGPYRLGDSFLTQETAKGDGVAVRVSVNGQAPLLERLVSPGSTIDFDRSLGFLQAGDTVYVAFGPGASQYGDYFSTDFSLYRIVPREPPLRQLAAAIVFHVNDYGARPDDNLDDRPAIEATLLEARQWQLANQLPVEVQFDPGVYDLDTPADPNAQQLLVLNYVSDLVINGRGAQILLGDPTRGLLQINGGSNVIIRDLVIDYKILPFTQGIIRAVDINGKRFVLEVEPGFSAPTDPQFHGSEVLNWGYAVDPQVPGRLLSNTRWHYGTKNAVALGQGLYEIQVPSFFGSRLAVGDRYIINARYNRALLGFHAGSKQVSVIGVTAYAAPSTFVSSTYSQAVNVIDSHVMIRPGSGRWRSIAADGVHLQSMRVGGWVESSSFDGLGDDVTNFYTTPFTLLDYPTNDLRTLHLASLNTSDGGVVPFHNLAFAPGDHLVFYDSAAGVIRGEARITSVDHLAQTVTVDHPLVGIAPGSGPDFLDDVTVYNRDLSGGFVIQDSRLSNSRRYGSYVMAHRGQIVDNLYLGISDEAIAGHNETGWPLGLFASDILVQGNEFVHNGFSFNYLSEPQYPGVVAFYMDRYADQLVDSPQFGYRNIQILDNTIYHWRKTAITVRNAQHVTIADNRVIAPALPGQPQAAIAVHWSRDVTVDSNAIADLPGEVAGVLVHEVDWVTIGDNPLVTTDGLVSWLKFDQAGGATAPDSASQYNLADTEDNPGQLIGGAQWTNGRLDGGVKLDGSGDSIGMDDSAQINKQIVTQRTISIWFKADNAELTSRKQVIYEEGGTGRGLNIYLFAGRLYVGGWNRAPTESGWQGSWLDTSVQSGRWHHVTLVLVGSETLQAGALRAYLDGRRFGTDQQGTGSQIWKHGSDIGVGGVRQDTRFHDGTVASSGHGLAGALDDLRIYNRVLTTAEIAALALWDDDA